MRYLRREDAAGAGLKCARGRTVVTLGRFVGCEKSQAQLKFPSADFFCGLPNLNPCSLALSHPHPITFRLVLSFQSSTSPTSNIDITAYQAQNLDRTNQVECTVGFISVIMPRLLSILTVLSAWFISSSFQFGFFDQMFGQQGHQQQQPQNVRSDSQWYQAQYEGGTSCYSTNHFHVHS